MGFGLLFPRLTALPIKTAVSTGLFGISQAFAWLSPAGRRIIQVLLTRAPLYSSLRTFSFDLHVLSTPPAFILSQNQTLHQDFLVTEVTFESESRMGCSNPIRQPAPPRGGSAGYFYLVGQPDD